jgi:hypothetical protein
VKGKAGTGTRFALLIYHRLYQMWFWPSLLLLVASVALIVLKPSFMSELYVWFVPVAIISAGLAGYSWLARHATYVQAHPHSLRIKSPLFRLVISYGRIHLVRTTQFKVQYPPETLSWTRRRLAEKLYGHTCLVVEVKGFPLSKRLLGVLLSYFLLTKQVDGFTLLVEDWLQLSNEIEAARATWVNRRLMTREKRAVEKILRD